MITVGRIAGILAVIVIVAWIYFLTGRVQLLLSYAEQIIDRDHGPTLPPDVRPEPARLEPPQPVAVHVTDQPTDPGQVPDVLPATEPATAPIPIGIPTVPQNVIPRLVEDVALARVLAEMEDRIYSWQHKKAEVA